MIDSAYAVGLLTLDAANWLRANGFCPVHQDLGEGDRIYDFCPVGCFASDTQILTGVQPDGKASYAAVSELRPTGMVMAMTEDANLRHITLSTLPLERMVYGPEEPALYVFALSTGATLKVTQHHPMVLDSGKIVEAEQLDPRARLVGVDGRPVEILSITRAQATDDVFNFQTASDAQLGHVIVAEGVLVGDLKLQNELAAEDSSIALRR